MSARSAMIRISKPERTSWFAEDSTERSDYQRTAAATPVRFAWWKIRSKESTALRAARSEPSSDGYKCTALCSSSSNLMQDRGVDAADLISFMLESILMA
ncbi:hypothetical protein glysoja_039223 [Glycine soja]|uniref:Uncharacterized protein n=1 Tax=Glycine soja TaxID=3848 RepID=A0A0B2QLS6_GLYSO|nr:hypothetical protein glysoja_039223 [Glycine soja]